MLQPINIYTDNLYKNDVSFKSINNAINAERAINALNSMQGMKGSLRLQGESLQKMISKLGDNGKKILDILSKNLKKPVIDISYKSSENGFVIGNVVIKDNNKQVGNCTISVTDLGTPQSILKYRLKLGDNGEIASSNGYLNNADSLSYDNYFSSLAKRNDVYESKLTIDNVLLDYTKINKKDFFGMLYKFFGIKIMNPLEECIFNIMKNVSDIQSFCRDLLSGKSVNLSQLKFISKLIMEKDAVYVQKVADEEVFPKVSGNIEEEFSEAKAVINKLPRKRKGKDNDIAVKLHKLNELLDCEYDFHSIKINSRINRPEMDHKIIKCKSSEEMAQKIEDEINNSAKLIRGLVSRGKKLSGAIPRYEKYIAYLMDLAEIKGLKIYPHLSNISYKSYRADEAAMNAIKEKSSTVISSAITEVVADVPKFYYTDFENKMCNFSNIDELKAEIQRQIIDSLKDLKHYRNLGLTAKAEMLENYVRRLRIEAEKHEIKLKYSGISEVREYYYYDIHGKMHSNFITLKSLSDAIQKEINSALIKIDALRGTGKRKSKEILELEDYVRSLRSDADANGAHLSNYGRTVVKDKS